MDDLAHRAAAFGVCPAERGAVSLVLRRAAAFGVCPAERGAVPIGSLAFGSLTETSRV
ncbi:MAG: hypothetical protein M3159_03155 [Actinomycetota bacterium]|nr:hypothetical protein [Actinomycetota bacterium]